MGISVIDTLTLSSQSILKESIRPTYIVLLPRIVARCTCIIHWHPQQFCWLNVWVFPFQGVPELPAIGISDNESGHKIGTIRRSRGTPTVVTQSSSHAESQDGKLELPKTYVTRSGALFLFTAPNNVELTEQQKLDLRQGLSRIRNTELKSKFGTLAKFTRSVLNYGNEVSNAIIVDEKKQLVYQLYLLWSGRWIWHYFIEVWQRFITGDHWYAIYALFQPLCRQDGLAEE